MPETVVSSVAREAEHEEDRFSVSSWLDRGYLQFDRQPGSGASLGSRLLNYGDLMGTS